jgi:hypothetical protein
MSKHTQVELGSRGSDIVAAGAPLEAIVAHVLTSYQECTEHSKRAIQTACNLLSTAKSLKHAVLSCEGAVAVDFSVATTEAAVAFAGGHHPSTGGFCLSDFAQLTGTRNLIFLY